MAIKRFIRAAAGLTAVVSAIFLWREMVGLGEVRRYNEALENKDFEQAANIDNEYGMFASAYHLQQQGSHQESRVLYTAIQKSNERALQLSPDSRALPNVEIPGRQNPNRTVISIDPEDSLP